MYIIMRVRYVVNPCLKTDGVTISSHTTAPTAVQRWMVMGMDEKILSLYVADIIVSLGFCTFMWLMFFFVKTIADNEMEKK